jgi:GntR family transcriptional regulator
VTDTNSFLPKYYQISLEIIKQIKAGEISPGSRVLSENEIIQQYEVSNTTARKVLLEIENAGLVERVRGKGTFVKDFVVDRAATKVLGFTRNMIEQGLVPETRLIDKEILPHDVSINASGRKYTIAGPVFKLRRLRLANKVPMMHETRYISMVFCPDIAEQDLEQSLYNIYKEKFHQNITEIKQDLSAIILNDESLKIFQVKKDVPGMKVVGVTFCGKEMILEGEESIYRGDKYKFAINATP